eukprot:TRINITY_DN4275_c0_g3_i1.p1 TRINITY_DN4275_c0_g3~~TRINITY_DN4275_c0_g3_i1.p1  ORF type:complete len:180 (-),score=94.67 TRINITY_DN4275_c0_g3_i1:74-613(-)
MSSESLGILLEAKKFKIEKRKVKLENGAEFEREVVVHPGAVCILPILADGSILLIRQFRFAVNTFLYELPAGTLENQEQPAACAARELEEETGYSATSIEPLTPPYFFPSPGVLSERMYAFVATGLTAVGQKLEATEDIKVLPHTVDQIRQLLATGAILDAKTYVILSAFLLQQSLPKN